MIHIRKFFVASIVLFSALMVLFTACQDRWEEHNKLNQNVAEGNLMQIISGHPYLSEFAGYLIQAGWDKELSSSKSFTVWAPTDEAMGMVEESILNDSVKLKLNEKHFIEYLINLFSRAT